MILFLIFQNIPNYLKEQYDIILLNSRDITYKQMTCCLEFETLYTMLHKYLVFKNLKSSTYILQGQYFLSISRCTLLYIRFELASDFF